MGKNIVVLLFLVSIALSLYAFFTREDRPIKIEVGEGAKQPRLVLEEFTVYKYDQHTVNGTLSAKLGYFLEPNMLELYGNVRGLRHSERREYFSADSSITYFEARGLTQLLHNAAVIKTELEGQVRAGANDYALRTEYAEFIAPQDLLRTDLPVKIEGPRGRFASEKGFEHYLKDNLMIVRGPMVGTLQERPLVE